MFERLRQVYQGAWYKQLFLVGSLLISSAYPIYKNYFYARGVEQYERQVQFMENRSDFYNPWQYRVFCPLLLQGAKWVYDHTIDRVFPLEEHMHFDDDVTPQHGVFRAQVRSKDAMIYLGLFILFRLLLQMLIYLLEFSLLAFFVKNNWLIGLGLLFTAYITGNGVHNSDLSFNTYLDVVLYLWAGCVILYRRQDAWIILITILGALNRETSLLIPVIYFASRATLPSFVSGQSFRWPPLRTWVITAASGILYIAIFAGIRMHYGYRAPEPVTTYQATVGLSLLKVNLASGQALKSYFEMYGVLSVLWLTAFFTFRCNHVLLRTWFLVLVPVWVLVHLLSSVVAESRCFLVPVVLVLLPMLLEKIEQQSPHVNNTAGI
ncbi:hypothetical protein GA0116948_11480 [Chitinophaga costaii]|uniref:Uncharacterized protein n=1 Tax=Chitinophaga costaii TaxID=1335309 RepID=A0A1C4FIS5_9BACT|nr:hypothetical protein [Chitinophaga costaii]PUZ20294.1 hypothetical protein DCM91_19180 [Chitinophaga costaii]SCC55543.1 hypothetical protein GA0116948_11480 [Chitinophaga costaii]